MHTIENNELMEYLKNAISLETDIATQETILENYTAHFQNNQPTLSEKSMPQPPIDYKDESVWLGLTFSFLGICISVGCTLPVILMDASLLVDASMIAAFLVMFLILLGSVRFAFSCVSEKKKIEETNNSNRRVYDLKCAQIQKENEEAQRAYVENASEWKESSDEVLGEVQTHLAQTRDLAAKLYASKDLIYPKYRTLAALTSIYEYFETGRCAELTGPNGAYNLYEDEMRKDMIISQLSAVLENLEQIKQNQYMLYQKACEIQQETHMAVSELRQIKGYTVQIASLTALNTYYAKLTERNTRISMWCTI